MYYVLSLQGSTRRFYMEIILETIDTLKGTIDYICEELKKCAGLKGEEEKKINLSLDLTCPECILVTKVKAAKPYYLCRWYRNEQRNSFNCSADEGKMVNHVREMVMVMTDLYLKEKFEQKCYEAYQLDWMICHGYSLNDLYQVMIKYEKEMFDPYDFRDSNGDMSYENEFSAEDLERSAMQARDIFLFEQGFGKSLVFASKSEFLSAEYRDKAYMKRLLENMPDSDKLLSDYKKYAA